MNTKVLLLFILRVIGKSAIGQIFDTTTIDMFDLTSPIKWKDMKNYYEGIATKKQRPNCTYCGFPEMGTTIHYQYHGASALKPAEIPIQNSLIKLIVIDATSMVKTEPNVVLSLDLVRQYLPVEQGLFQPTVILFKFGWTHNPDFRPNNGCFCQIPGISFDLAVWIALHLDHVVGVATDAPSLESQETRNSTTGKTITALLGKSGVYMIENVNATLPLPERGCLAIITPLKLQDENYVPARITAFCPPRRKEKVEIIMAAESKTL